ncbi:MAG TPA: CBS domain-containing protein [Jatrophihabitans sp.]|nr:CBS domain-containing protein [Jatrophihabitans sp.]
MNISDILRYKGAEVFTMTPPDSVAAAAARLAEHRIGALLVLDGETVAGIVSERDIVRGLAERGASILEAPVSELMTSPVLTCTSADSVDSVAETMTQKRARHMPVVNDGRLAGMVSIGDVVSSRMRQLEHDRGALEHYIAG